MEQEVWRWLFGGGGLAVFFGLFGWMAKKFYEKNIEGAINSASAVANQALDAVNSAKTNFDAGILSLTQSQNHLAQTVTGEISKLRDDLSEQKLQYVKDSMKLKRGRKCAK